MGVIGLWNRYPGVRVPVLEDVTGREGTRSSGVRPDPKQYS